MADFLSFDGISCTTPIVAEQVGWAMVLAGGILATVRHVRAFQVQVRVWRAQQERKRARGEQWPWYRHWPLRIIVLGFVTFCPGCFIVSGIKLAGAPHREVGQDILPSVGYIAVAVIGFIANVYTELKTIGTMFLSSKFAEAESERLLLRLDRRYRAVLVLYVLGMTTACILGCFFPKPTELTTLGIAMLLLRNVSVILMVTAMAQINRTVIKEVKAMMSALSNMPSGENAKMLSLLTFLEDAGRAKRKSSFGAMVVFGLACTPPLWPYATFFNVFAVLQVTVPRNHPVCAFMSHTSKVAQAVTQSKSKPGMEETASTIPGTEIATSAAPAPT